MTVGNPIYVNEDASCHECGADLEDVEADIRLTNFFACPEHEEEVEERAAWHTQEVRVSEKVEE